VGHNPMLLTLPWSVPRWQHRQRFRQLCRSTDRFIRTKATRLAAVPPCHSSSGWPLRVPARGWLAPGPRQSRQAPEPCRGILPGEPCPCMLGMLGALPHAGGSSRAACASCSAEGKPARARTAAEAALERAARTRRGLERATTAGAWRRRRSACWWRRPSLPAPGWRQSPHAQCCRLSECGGRRLRRRAGSSTRSGSSRLLPGRSSGRC
jgi:hypothetical protein